MSTTQETGTVAIENVGPISGEFRISLEGPGLYELTGSKGRGKTTILNSLEILAGRKVLLTVHQDAQEGKISGFGLVTPVGKRRTQLGDREVEVLDSERFSLIDLIDPVGKTAKGRDANRIKALATMLGVEITADHFYEIAGSQELYDQLNVQPTSDPILFCQRFKDKLDAAARGHETTSDREEGKAQALTESVAQVTTEPIPSEADLLHALQEALVERGSVRANRKAALDANGRRRAMEESLARLRSKEITSVEGAESRVESWRSSVAASDDRIRRMRKQIAELTEECDSEVAERKALAVEFEAADRELTIAKAHHTSLETLEHDLQKSVPVNPTDEEVEAAEKAVSLAQLHQTESVEVRDAIRKREQAKAHMDDAITERQAADRYRNQAKSVFGLLAQRMTTSHIKVVPIEDAPRLVVDHPRGPQTLFDQVDGLSDGERVMYSIRELLPHLGSPGLFPIPQRTYQDLPPADRQALADYAGEHGLYLFGAQVTDGELQIRKV